jgi:hypothetical protein
MATGIVLVLLAVFVILRTVQGGDDDRTLVNRIVGDGG